MDKLIALAQSGDDKAMAELAGQYKNLVRSVANKFFLVGGDKDDLLQEGMLGLFYAVNNYDNAKGNFTTFARLCVTRQIITAVRKEQSDGNKPLFDYVELSSLEDIAYESEPLNGLLGKELADKVNYVIQHDLTKTEKIVLELFVEGYTYDEISAKLNKSYKSIDGALQRARKKLLAVKE